MGKATSGAVTVWQLSGNGCAGLSVTKGDLQKSFSREVGGNCSFLHTDSSRHRSKSKRGPILASADVHLHLLLVALNELLVKVLISICRRFLLHLEILC